MEERIDDLLSRMTLAEKIGQMMHENPAIDRLGVPQYNWWNEACHGIGRAGRATVFPQVIGMAATWNRELLHDVANAISDEARAKHHYSVSKGKRGQFQGLTFWTPNINIVRDPRWGRGQETFGEDPYLTAELGSEVVKGLQGDDPKYLKTAACAKHFAVHSGPESERHEFDAKPTPKDLEETYLPAFKKLVDTGVEAVMGAYNRTLGEACCASEFLMNDILRGRWGYKGHYVSDCGAIDDFHNYHGVTKNAAESAALAVRTGCDLNCGCTYGDLIFAVDQGLVSEEDINRSVRRLLRTKFKLGLFDAPDSLPWGNLPLDIVDGPANRALARKAAAESVVLLKNKDSILPLRRNPERVLVVGPTAANYGALLGNYYGVAPEMVTIFQGILEAVEPNTPVKYRPSCPLFSAQAPGVNYTEGAAEAAEIVIAVMGLDHTLEGEEGDTVASPSGGDRDTIELPAVQMNFLRSIRKFAKKLVLVLTGGSAIACPEAFELCDAVLMAWYPGCEGGRGVADVLFGAESPSGRLPVSVAKSTEDLPAFNDYSMKGRTYRFADKEPLFPFGFGLGYGKVSYSNAVADKANVSEGGHLSVHATVRNDGERACKEVVQCYIVPPQDWPNAPKSTLVAFTKLNLEAGESREVSFTLSADSFMQFDAEGRRVLPAGSYGIVVGSSSPCKRSEELGAAKPAQCSVSVL
ncbi:MAG: glycoside hydrolase family 3 C-terminal domain-containing protein [Opitutales bacterium]|nr:glycoside hydrolase family 3 C-terminal domain-containing protein [Opitutales bacterium]